MTVKEYIKTVWDGTVALCQGLDMTLRYLFAPKDTIRYPEKKRIFPERFRGRFAYLFNQETGKPLCIACEACIKVCPAQAITIVTSKGEDKKKKMDNYIVNIGSCISCGNCMDVCPVGAITLTHEFELATPDKLSLEMDMHKLRKDIKVEKKKSNPKDEKTKKEGTE